MYLFFAKCHFVKAEHYSINCDHKNFKKFNYESIVICYWYYFSCKGIIDIFNDSLLLIKSIGDTSSDSKKYPWYNCWNTSTAILTALLSDSIGPMFKKFLPLEINNQQGLMKTMPQAIF